MKYNYLGLSTSEVEKSRSEHGANNLASIKGESFYDKLKQNFKDPIIIILNVALVVILILSFLGFSEWYEALAIGKVVQSALEQFADAEVIGGWLIGSDEDNVESGSSLGCEGF